MALPTSEVPPNDVIPTCKTLQVAAETNGIPVLAFRPKQACQALGIGERLLWSLTNQGQIPHIKLGRCTVYPVGALEKWLAEQAEGGTRR